MHRARDVESSSYTRWKALILFGTNHPILAAVVPVSPLLQSDSRKGGQSCVKAVARCESGTKLPSNSSIVHSRTVEH